MGLVPYLSHVRYCKLLLLALAVNMWTSYCAPEGDTQPQKI